MWMNTAARRTSRQLSHYCPGTAELFMMKFIIFRQSFLYERVTVTPQRSLVIQQDAARSPCTVGVTIRGKTTSTAEEVWKRFFYYAIKLRLTARFCLRVLEELTKPLHTAKKKNLVSPPAHITQLFKCNSCFLPQHIAISSLIHTNGLTVPHSTMRLPDSLRSMMCFDF